MTRLRVVMQSNARAMDVAQVIDSSDDVYRIALWSLTTEEDRSIYLPGSRGGTWRSVEGLRIEEARSGSIELDLTPIITSGTVVLILGKLVDLLTVFMNNEGLGGI